MSEQRPVYMTSTQPIAAVVEIDFAVSEWERNVILRMRQAAESGTLVIVDPDARCWWVAGRMECNKADRDARRLPFEM